MMKKNIIIVILILAVTYSCSPEAEKSVETIKAETEIEKISEGEIKDIIERYNKLLAGAYITNDTKGMKEVITADHDARLYHRLSNIAKSKRQMQSELKKLKFSDVRFLNDKTASVKTGEAWDIIHYDLNTQQTIKEHKGYLYELKYEVVKQKGNWLINNVEVLDEKPSQ